MARKGADLLAELDDLGAESQQSPSAPAAPVSPRKATTSTKPASVTTEDDEEAQALSDLQSLSVRPQGTSRPTTPRLSSSTTSGTQPKHTPASSGPPSGRTSEDRARGNASTTTTARSSGEGRSYHQSFTPSEEQKVRVDEKPAATAASSSRAGGWGFGGWLTSAASAAVSQAQSLAKEIQGNEEAQRWAEQVKGYAGNLQHLGTDLRSRALPTFTSLISHIAPPISAHERLQIHTTHDIVNYPSLDPLIYTTFSRVMSQVEGGDLLVIQRGSENRSRSRTSSEPQGYRGGVLGSGGSGWTDGPWWREEGVKRDLGAVPGLKEGTRLTRVSAESYAREFFDARGGVEEAAKKATETLSESNPTRSSDIFLAIQAISYTNDSELFAGDARDSSDEKIGQVIDQDEEADEQLIAFAIYLYDPIHSLSFSTLSQPFPQKWTSWLDATAENDGLPDSILEIIESGGVDPREWVAEWLEEILTLGVGVVAQNYVARRMGVGEGGLGRGKRRVEEDGTAGEAARAV